MHSKTMKFGMLACCMVMITPIVLYFAAGGALAGVKGSIATFSPLLLCAVAHVLMFKVIGKSCHGEEKNSGAEIAPEEVVERPTDIPASGTLARAKVKH